MSPGADLSISRSPRPGLFRGLLLVGGATAMAIFAGIVLGVASNYPVLVWGILVPMVVHPFLWLRPTWAVYGLVIGATIFESFGLNYPDSLTDRLPFFKSFNSMGSPIPFPVTPAELLIFAGLLMVILQRMANRERPLATGPLFWAIGVYSLAVLIGFFHGIGTGGALRPAIWEIRPLMYLLPAYLLAFNLMRTHKQINLVFWLFLGAVAFKGILGSWRYLVTLGGDLARIEGITSHNSLLAHEESLFFALFFVFIIVMWLVRSGGNQLRFAVALSPPVLLAFLANQRRVGTLALLVGALVVCLLAYHLVQHRQKLVRSLALVAAATVPIYVALQGSGGTLLAEPARAIASIYSPDERDLSSNLYRSVETGNLQRNILASPLLGHGYGKPIIWYEPLPDLSDLFIFWEYIPHNTLLWVWMRTGFLGFVVFWFMIGRFLVEALMVARSQRSPYIQGIAIWSVAATLGWLAMGALDQGLVDFRSTILLGVVMGLVSRLSTQAEPQDSTNSSKGPEISSGHSPGP